MRATISAVSLIGLGSMAFSFSANALVQLNNSNPTPQVISCFSFSAGSTDPKQLPVVEITPGSVNEACQTKDGEEYCAQYIGLPEGAVSGALGFVSINVEFKEPVSLQSGSLFVVPAIPSFQKATAEIAYLAGKEVQVIGNSFLRLENNPTLNIQCFSIKK